MTSGGPVVDSRGWRRVAWAIVGALMTLAAGGFASGAAGQSAGRQVAGLVLDSQTTEAIPGMTVAVRGLAIGTVTDSLGVFRITALSAGEWTLELTHVAYGHQTHVVVVDASRDLSLEIRVSRRAIDAAPVVVEVDPDLSWRALSSGHSMREITRPSIALAARSGLTLPTLLQQQMAGLRVRGGRSGACVEYRGSTSGGECKEIAVVLDGLLVANPSSFYGAMPLNDIERMELLSPSESGLLYGTHAGSGVLLVETRTGPRRLGVARNDRLISGLDWSGESEPYPWTRVLVSSIVANAAGFALGVAVADNCLAVSNTLSWGLTTRCGGAGTMASSVVSVAAPTLAGTYASRWAGSTSRSNGRISTTAIMGALTVVSGYMLWIHGSARDDSFMKVVGLGTVTVGAPVAMTLSDRLLRELR
jgi:hypothetical protein